MPKSYSGLCGRPQSAEILPLACAQTPVQAHCYLFLLSYSLLPASCLSFFQVRSSPSSCSVLKGRSLLHHPLTRPVHLASMLLNLPAHCPQHSHRSTLLPCRAHHQIICNLQHSQQRITPGCAQRGRRSASYRSLAPGVKQIYHRT